MTENKRFIRIVDHLEKEVRIYDTINEKKIFNIFFNELDSAICLNGALTDTVELLNDLSEENEQLKKELHKIYELATVNKVKEIVENVYDELLYETSEKSDYARNKVLECLEKLDEFGDELE